MDVSADLKAKGWHLSKEGLEICKEGIDRVTTPAIIQKALNTDLREIGGNFFPDDMKGGKLESISGSGVVQIQKIKNATAPKYEYGSGAPPILRLILTDGNTYFNCLQWGTWKSINMDIPPGTKVYLKPGKIQVQNSFMLLRENQFTVLGGHVTHMVEKWELSNQLASLVRTKDNLDGTGPPPWIPFGKPILIGKAKTGNFRALDQDAKEAKENEVFKQQRLANIAEVSKAKEGKPKVFGGGKDKLPSSKSDLDPNHHNSNNSTDRSQGFNKFQRNYNEPDSRDSSRKPNDDQGYRNSNFGSRNDSFANRNDSRGNRTHDYGNRNQGYSNDGNRTDGGQGNRKEYGHGNDGSNRRDAAYHDDSRWNRNNDYGSRNEEPGYRNNRNWQNTDSQRFSNESPSQFNQSFQRDRKADQGNRYPANNSQNSRNYGWNQDRSQDNSHRSNFDTANGTGRFTRTSHNNRSSGNAYGDARNDRRGAEIENITQRTSEIKLHGYDTQNDSEVVIAAKPFIKPGVEVLAKYWEDHKVYHAIIHAVGQEGKTCVVRFLDYGNYEEVLVDDVQQIQVDSLNSGWNAGPLSFQPSHWEGGNSNQDFPAISELNHNYNRPQNRGQQNRQRGPRQDHKPSAELYLPPRQRRTP